MKTKLIKILHYVFWIAVVGLIIGLVWGGFLVQKILKSGELEVEIHGPEKVNIGVPFYFSVNFSNNTKSILKQARLRVFLPGEINCIGKKEQRVLEEDLGDIGIGSFSKKTFQLIAQGEHIGGTIQKINVELSYQPTGLVRTRLARTGSFDILIEKPAVFLDLVAPAKVLSGENFKLEVNLNNLSSYEFPDLRLELNYPPNFKFKNSSIAPGQNNNVWEISNIKQSKIVIEGNLVGPVNSFSQFLAKIKTRLLGEEYIVNKKSISMAIAPSPLEIEIELAGVTDGIVDLGQELEYLIKFQNKTEVGLSDVVIKAGLVGRLFDFSELVTEGDFYSKINTIVWDASNTPQLKMLSAGEKGVVSFRIKLRDYFPIYKLTDKNFTLNVNASIESPTVPPSVSANRIFGSTSLETKVRGVIMIQTKVYFRDASSGIVNKGVWPPRVNKPTNYTVHFLITNYSTDVSNVKVQAYLGPGVKFTGIVKSDIESLPEYNERTKQVTWTIDRIPAATGVLSKSLEAIFQIEATPDVTKLGKYQTLIQDTYIQALDEFTSLKISDTAPAVTTRLPHDKTVQELEGIVRD